MPPPVPPAPLPSTTPASDAAPSTVVAVTMSFAEGSGGNVRRTCSDNAAKRARASLYEATGIVVVPVKAPSGAVGPVLADGYGAGALTALKNAVSKSGAVTLPLDIRYLSTAPCVHHERVWRDAGQDPRRGTRCR